MNQILKFLSDNWIISVVVVGVILAVLAVLVTIKRKRDCAKDNCGCEIKPATTDEETQDNESTEEVQSNEFQDIQIVCNEGKCKATYSGDDNVEEYMKKSEVLNAECDCEADANEEASSCEFVQLDDNKEIDHNNKIVDVKEEKVEEIKEEKVEVVADTATKNSGGKGKWLIVKQSDDEYLSRLIASNGVVMLTSEVYKTVDGAIKGIDTIKKNIQADNFDYFCDKNRNCYFKLKTANNRILCVGQMYSSKQTAENSIDSLKRFSVTAVLEEEVKEENSIIKYEPTEEIEPVKGNSKGKWMLIESEGYYFAQLIASNGEVLLTSESYSTVASVKSAMSNIKKNALEFNFIIDKDKNNKFYYKLRNAQKSVLCVGAVYETLKSCISSIESVIRFCKSAVDVEEAFATTED